MNQKPNSSFTFSLYYVAGRFKKFSGVFYLEHGSLNVSEWYLIRIRFKTETHFLCHAHLLRNIQNVSDFIHLEHKTLKTSRGKIPTRASCLAIKNFSSVPNPSINCLHLNEQFTLNNHDANILSGGIKTGGEGVDWLSRLIARLSLI